MTIKKPKPPAELKPYINSYGDVIIFPVGSYTQLNNATVARGLKSRFCFVKVNGEVRTMAHRTHTITALYGEVEPRKAFCKLLGVPYAMLQRYIKELRAYEKLVDEKRDFERMRKIAERKGYKLVKIK